MEGSSPSEELTSVQAKALFDFLTHYETYAEIEGFKNVSAIHSYGPPFQNDDQKSTSPILQTLLSRFLLTLPGLRDVQGSFWQNRVCELVAELSSANLSESFDKGDIGQRKTLATAISALLEYIARGTFGGLPRRPLKKESGEYDVSNPEDLSKAWHDMLQQLVYNDLLDEMAEKIAETDQLSEHKTLVQAAHRYILVNVASLLHYTLIMSPKGPALLSLLEMAHKLIPYTVIRQTLKVGNAATMISGMVKIVLAKASVGAVTNWLGLSHGVDEGMNLLQTIISTVLSWDTRRFKKEVTQIEKDKKAPSKEQLADLKDYVTMTPAEQEVYRTESKTIPRSLAASILRPVDELSPENEKLASTYLAAQLSIQDRQSLISILCSHHPDLLTPILKALVSAYDPIIRRIHDAIDLPAGLSDAEAFINDLIAVSKAPSSNNKDTSESGSSKPRVSVQQYISLLERHQSSIHRFLHQFAKNDPELLSWYISWTRQTISEFHIPQQPKNSAKPSESRDAKIASLILPSRSPIPSQIASVAASLRETQRTEVFQELDAYATYLATLSSNSDNRAKAILKSKGSESSLEPSSRASDERQDTGSGAPGPGVFLAKWQNLIDETAIGPPTSVRPDAKQGDEAGDTGHVTRHGDSSSLDGSSGGDAATKAETAIEADAHRAPSMQKTIEHLAPEFHNLLKEYVYDTWHNQQRESNGDT